MLWMRPECARAPFEYAGSGKNDQLLSSRHAAPFIRHVLARFRQKVLAPAQAAAEFGVSRSRLSVLYASYLAACAQRLAHRWLPGISGGDQRTVWPPDVLALLRKLLGSRPPASYSFAASEVHRHHALPLARATVRRWALANDLAPDSRQRKPPEPPMLELIDDHRGGGGE